MLFGMNTTNICRKNTTGYKMKATISKMARVNQIFVLSHSSPIWVFIVNKLLMKEMFNFIEMSSSSFWIIIYGLTKNKYWRNIFTDEKDVFFL